MTPMRLTVHAPWRLVVDTEIDKIVANGPEGSFCLLPKHVDWVSSVTPGIITYVADGVERYLATGRGLLVKRGYSVDISTRRVIEADSLEQLRSAVQEAFSTRSDLEQRARAASTKLEVGFVRRFLELEE